MKTKILLLLAFFILSLTPGHSQLNKEKRKKFRQERKIEIQKQVDHMMATKNFVFVARTAFPSGGSAVDLTTNSNSIKFNPDKIYCYMPFFGEAYNVDYRGDPGFKFDTKPESFEIRKLKKDKGFDVEAAVALPRDHIKLSLQVSPEGSSTLSILSDQRKSISYFGYITEPDQIK